MSEGYVLTVTQLNNYTSSLLSNDALLSNLSVKGEISGFKHHSSGHMYFSLKDDESLVRCVMFRQNAMQLEFRPEDGMEVTASGYASLYVKDGQYQLYVKGMTQGGEGALYRRFMLMKNRLEAEGLFDAAHKKPLPMLPKRIGLITSGTGAAVQDMINITRRRYPMMDIALCPVAVQGAGAAQEIAAGIRLMNELKAADVLIVGRGGGSMEDLFAFNDEAVARAIYDSEIPIVSAVGHETDFTIADFVADLRAPTPSAAAELCVPEYEALVYEVERSRRALNDAVYGALDLSRDRVSAIMCSSGMAVPRHRLALMRNELNGICADMRTDARNALASSRAEAAGLGSALRALSPNRVLERGYAMVRADNEYIGSAKELVSRCAAGIIFADGTVDVRVKGKA